MTAAVAQPKLLETKQAAASTQQPAALAPAHLQIQEIPVHLIVRSETNRLPQITDDFLDRIRGGINSPILVRPIKATQEHTEIWQRIDEAPIKVGDTIYKLVFGERRWEASKRLGFETVPGMIRELTDTEALEIQVHENEDREDYSPLDRADAYAHLHAQYMKDHHGEKGWTNEKCCALIADTCKNDKIKGRSVDQIISLKTKLHPFCQAALRQGEMEASHGYEIARRSEEEQLELLKWLRKETQHSQGDIPSTRRLKREIQDIDRIAEEKRRQQKLFKDTQVGPTDKLTFDGKTIDILPESHLPTSIKRELLKAYPRLTTAFCLKDSRIQLVEGLTGKPFYLTAKELQNVLTTGVPYETGAPAQTLADEPDWVRNKVSPAAQPKTAGQLARAEQLAQSVVVNTSQAHAKVDAQLGKQREETARQDREKARRVRVHKIYTNLSFIALAKKAQLNARFMGKIIPNLIFEVWENEWPIDSFCQEVLGWPAPKSAEGYEYVEVKRYCEKHTRKFTHGVMASLMIALYMGEESRGKLARYYGIDPKKLQQKAEAAVKEEERVAALPREPKTKEEKQLHRALHHYQGNDKVWEKLRKKGASDAELKKAIGERMGDGGSTTEIGSVEHKGGADPAVWFNCMNRHAAKPSLRGAALIAAVRDLLKIPEKGDVDA